MAEHYTKETEGKVGSIATIEEAHKAHHLATADPEPERGIGTETGPAHEQRFSLEREKESAAHWRSRGVHPYENRALRPGDEGYVSDDDLTDDKPVVETAEKRGSVEIADAPRARRTSA